MGGPGQTDVVGFLLKPGWGVRHPLGVGAEEPHEISRVWGSL